MSPICRVRSFLPLLFLTTSSFLTPARAAEDPFAAIRDSAPAAPVVSVSVEEAGWFERTREQARLSMEWLARGGWDDGAERRLVSEAVGLELFAPIVTPTGTWGRLDVQFRVALDFPVTAPDFQAHTVTLEKRFLFGRLNLRAGHFELPFGLVGRRLDTHTTIVQLGTMPTLGVKHDWGLGLRGQLAQVDYDLAYTLGAGMDPDLPGAGAGAGRLGWTSADRGFGLGVSAFAGERRLAGATTGPPTFGYRFGFDLGGQLGPLWLGLEAAAGQDEGALRLSSLARLMAESATGAVQGVLQYGVQGKGEQIAHRGEIEVALRLGFLSRESFLRLNAAVEQRGSGSPAWIGLSQLYVRFSG